MFISLRLPAEKPEIETRCFHCGRDIMGEEREALLCVLREHIGQIPAPRPTKAQLDYPLVCAECGAYLVKVIDSTRTAGHVLQHLISGRPCSKSGKTFEPIIFELKEILNIELIGKRPR